MKNLIWIVLAILSLATSGMGYSMDRLTKIPGCEIAFYRGALPRVRTSTLIQQSLEDYESRVEQLAEVGSRMTASPENNIHLLPSLAFLLESVNKQLNRLESLLKANEVRDSTTFMKIASLLERSLNSLPDPEAIKKAIDQQSGLQHFYTNFENDYEAAILENSRLLPVMNDLVQNLK